MRAVGKVVDASDKSVAVKWEPVSGRRKQRRPQKTWQATFKEDLQAMGATWRGAKRAVIVIDRSHGRNSSPNVTEGTEAVGRN